MSKRKPKNQKEASGGTGGQGRVQAWMTNTRLQAWIIPVFAILLYANTLGHDFTQDDAIVITDNVYTQQGIAGIPGILQYDTFFGFFQEAGKDRLVSGGRYRPFSLILFAIEKDLFGGSAFVGHLFNILFFAFTCWLLYQLLLSLFFPGKEKLIACTIAFLGALLFAAHPIHTEVVANIKGRDEILALLGSLGAMYLAHKALQEKRYLLHLPAALLFFAALLSKENSITFLAVIPITYYFFQGAGIRKTATHTAPYLLPVLAFLFIRASVIGWGLGDPPMELMNNPFIKIVEYKYVPFEGAEKLATILLTLGKYLALLFFPHPLTHDYYPRHIGIMDFSHWEVWLSLLAYLSLLVIAIRGFRRRSAISFAILYFLLTLSIVSNFVFPIGTNMAERLIFMPSVGFCLALPLALLWLHDHFGLPKRILAIWIGLMVFSLGLGARTLSRNLAWKDNFTLFTTDIQTSPNSAKLQNAVAGELITRATELDDEVRRNTLLKEAVTHLKTAVAIHPNYKNAYLLLGNAHNYLKAYDDAITYYQRALQLDPNYRDARNNLGITYRDAGRYYGEQKGDLEKALKMLNSALKYRPDDYETLRLLGVAYGISGQNEQAISFFTKALEQDPDNPDMLYNLGSAYYNAGQPETGARFHRQAIEIDPEVVSRMRGGQ